MVVVDHNMPSMSGTVSQQQSDRQVRRVRREELRQNGDVEGADSRIEQGRSTVVPLLQAVSELGERGVWFYSLTEAIDSTTLAAGIS